jgi:hypothetical protein
MNSRLYQQQQQRQQAVANYSSKQLPIAADHSIKSHECVSSTGCKLRLLMMVR